MHRKQVFTPAVVVCVILALAAGRVWAAEPEKAAKEGDARFLRFVDDQEGGGKLQTSIVTYTNPQGVKVHLVAAVHVGEGKYYEGLNQTFEGYDALLYELVKPKGAGVPTKDFKSQSLISAFQRMLKDVLDLDFQLDDIDYTAKNFVHADLDAETFARLQEERGENIFILMLREMLNEMSKPQQNVPEISLPELLVAFTAPDRARHFKLMLAQQFEGIESRMAGLEGPNGSVLVTERDKAAIRALKETMGSGKKNIGIFYGAAHMNDLSKRLEDMGFKQTKVEWRTAWDMTPKEGDVVVRVVKKKPTTQP